MGEESFMSMIARDAQQQRQMLQMRANSSEESTKPSSWTSKEELEVRARNREQQLLLEQDHERQMKQMQLDHEFRMRRSSFTLAGVFMLGVLLHALVSAFL